MRRALSAALACLLLPPALPRSAGGSGPPLFSQWTRIGTAQGLPSDKVMSVAADGPRVWVGTEKGLALLERGRVRKVYREADGMPAPAVVLSLAVDPLTGDVWAGTMGGAVRISGGRVDAFTQLNSGLANNVVYGLKTHGGDVWFATAAGLSRYTLSTKSWEIYDINNTLMAEPWTYGVDVRADGTVFVAVWGGGILERQPDGTFREHRDPDGELEVDRLRDDGLVHEVTSAVAVEDKAMWAGTYFGLSRYDGRSWRSYSTQDSGLASDFINFMRTKGGAVWIATDQGFSVFDSKTWRTWRQPKRGGPFRLAHQGGERAAEANRPHRKRKGARLTNREHVALARRSPPANMIYGLELGEKGDIWLATADGLFRGRGGAR